MTSFKWSGFQVFVDHMKIFKVIRNICWDVEASWASQALISPTSYLGSVFSQSATGTDASRASRHIYS